MPLPFNSPLGSAKANDLIEVLALDSSSRVVDVGCGTGEFLIRVVERYGCQGLGVDIDASALAQARDTAGPRAPDADLEFLEVDATTRGVAAGAADCAICLGASHAFALDEPAYPEALKGLIRLVRPGGLVLIGEGFWMQPPSDAYLAFIGEHVGCYRTHEENVEVAQGLGLVPYYAIASSLEEWDAFEWGHVIEIERAAAASPDDAQKQARLARSRRWQGGYLKWGRGTMGFAFYLFATPH